MSSSTFMLPLRSVWRAAGLVGKAATIADSKKRTKYRPSRHPGHSRDTRTYGPHAQSVPGQDRPRRSAAPAHLVPGRHEAHFMCPPDPQRARRRQMQRIHLTPCLPSSSCPFVPCSWLPCSASRVVSPGDLLRLIWSPGVVFLVPGRLSWI